MAISRIPSLFPEFDGLQDSALNGVLPSQFLEEFISAGYIAAPQPIRHEQIQPASLDLRLGPVAYRVRASFLPSTTSTVLRKVDEFKIHEMSLESPAVLERGCVYIVPLLEELRLPPTVAGKANPKSTIGRLDVFTRLITDYGSEFESVPLGYNGKLYVEIIPRTFSILVRAGNQMNQLRLVKGEPKESDLNLSLLHDREILVYRGDLPADPTISNGLWLSVDLDGNNGSDVIGFKAKRYAPLVDLEALDYYDPQEYWEYIQRPPKKQIILDPDEFYILASKERIRVPPSVAAEMVGYDASVGEFRIHYAGFFDPGFGYGTDDIKGTHAVLEVRSHGVPFLLEDGQRVGRLLFEPLLAPPKKVYGPQIGSSYQEQGLALSKQFRRPK
jgi:dCTP deaminase